MKLVLIALACIFLILILLIILLGIFRTILIESKPQQTEFLKGIVPKKLPDGFYKGSVDGLKTTWQGKRFNASGSSGINVFQAGENKNDRYPFITYLGKGVQDTDLEVLKIDYSGNLSPWWLKYILDEIVEVAPGKYLGKVHITLIPGLPFSIGFFRLEK